MRQIGRSFELPLLANMVEGGRTPVLSQQELEAIGYKLAIFPVTALLAYDTRFYEQAAKLFPHNPQFYDGFANNAELAQSTALRNATLQSGYFLLAARAVGLDCGPMSGFNEALLNSSFFPDGQYRINFLCNLGYGDPEKLFGRLPRLSFEEACEVL